MVDKNKIESVDVTPVSLHPDMAVQLISDALRAHKAAEPVRDKWLKYLPIILVLGAIAGSVVMFWDRVEDHVDEKSEHFLPDIQGERKQDFAKVKLVDEKIKGHAKELNQVLEVQQMKQQLQMRQVLQEYRENFSRFKIKTRNMAKEMDEVGDSSQ